VNLSTSTVYVMCNTMEHQSYVHALETSCMPQQRGTYAGAHQMSHLAIPRGERLRQKFVSSFCAQAFSTFFDLPHVVA
jgi:hypothetical protein